MRLPPMPSPNRPELLFDGNETLLDLSKLGRAINEGCGSESAFTQ